MSDESKVDKWLYLFSSNTTDLYAVDALTSLALPRGWIQHYRYRDVHLSDDLISALPETSAQVDKLSKIEGLPVLIVYVNQQELQDSDMGYTVLGLYPLRVGRVVRVFKDGGVAHFWFSLQDYLEYDPPTEGGVGKHKELLEAAISNKTPHQGIYATLGDPYGDSGVGDDAASRAFQSAVRVISGHGFGKEATIFARFHGLKEIDAGKNLEDQEALAVTSGPLPNESGYDLHDDRMYGIDVSIYHTDSLDKKHLRNAALVLDFDRGHFIEVGRTRNAIAGKYDRFVLPIAVARHRRDQWTSLTVLATAGADSPTTGGSEGQDIRGAFRGPEWIIPVHVKVRRWTKFLWALPRGMTEGAAVAGSGAAAALVATNQDVGWIVLAIGTAVAGVLGKILLQTIWPAAD